jgi:hypothetical protein
VLITVDASASNAYFLDQRRPGQISRVTAPMRAPMTEITLQVGFMEMLSLPLDRHQRLDILRSMAQQADWLTAEDVLLAAALLDHASRSRVDGRALPVEQVAQIQSRYIERLVADDDPEIARVLAEALAVRERPAMVN